MTMLPVHSPWWAIRKDDGEWVADRVWCCDDEGIPYIWLQGEDEPVAAPELEGFLRLDSGGRDQVTATLQHLTEIGA